MARWWTWRCWWRWAWTPTATDNALCESFFPSLECELIDRITLRTFTRGRREIFDYIEGWYNPHRRHSALGYLSPINYDRTRRAAA